MTLVFDTKVALFEALKANAPGGTQCTFAQTGDADRGKQIWLGETIDDELKTAAFHAQPRKPTDVSASVDVHLLATSPGDPMDAERQVYALREAAVSACVSVDRAAIPGLMDLRAESAAVETGESADGSFSMMTIRVRIRGRVTQ